MKITSVSQNELTQINNASTLEDLQNLKNLIKSSIIEQNSDEEQISDFSIRILSNLEYEKYILSSTAGGSITANNIDVWQHQASTICLFQCTNARNSNAEWFNACKSHILKYFPSADLSSLWIQKIQTGQANGYANFSNLYFEIRQNNNSNLINFFPPNKLVFFLASCGFPNSYTMNDLNRYSTDADNQNQHYFINDRISNNIVKSTTNSYMYKKGSWIDNGYGRYMSVDIQTGFRPVFQYKDNKKSKNIYC